MTAEGTSIGQTCVKQFDLHLKKKMLMKKVVSKGFEFLRQHTKKIIAFRMEYQLSRISFIEKSEKNSIDIRKDFTDEGSSFNLPTPCKFQGRRHLVEPGASDFFY